MLILGGNDCKVTKGVVCDQVSVGVTFNPALRYADSYNGADPDNDIHWETCVDNNIHEELMTNKHSQSRHNEIHVVTNDIHGARSGGYLPQDQEGSAVSLQLIGNDDVFVESVTVCVSSRKGRANASCVSALKEVGKGTMTELFDYSLVIPEVALSRSAPLFSIEENSSDNDSSYSSEEEMQMYLKGPCRTIVNPKKIIRPRSLEDISQTATSLSRDGAVNKRRTCSAEAVMDGAPMGLRSRSPRPRKSSIVLPGRKRSNVPEGGRRRSVHFEPEVVLQSVVTEGDIEEVKDVLQNISDVNRMSPIGLTALHQSALDGNWECASMLILNGADVNVQDCEGWTPLHAAAIEGHAEFVRCLLLANADPGIHNDDNETPSDIAENRQVKKMLLSAMNGNFLAEFSDPLVLAESDAEEVPDEEGESDGYADDDESNADEENDVLRSSMSVKSLVNVRRKEKAGRDSSALATTSSTTDEKRTPEQVENSFKLNSGSISSIDSYDLEPSDKSCRSPKLLLDFNIDEDQGISTMEGSSDSHNGLRLDEPQYSLDPTLEAGSPDYLFQEAILSNDVEELTRLLKVKDHIRVDYVSESSKVAAIHHAVLEENFVMLQLLVKDFKADVHTRDHDGWTPLHAASAVGSIQIAQFLLDNGAKASILNNQCEFPVDVAADETMEVLLKKAMLGPPSTVRLSTAW